MLGGGYGDLKTNLFLARDDGFCDSGVIGYATHWCMGVKLFVPLDALI